MMTMAMKVWVTTTTSLSWNRWDETALVRHSSTENSERTVFNMCDALWGVQTRRWQARSVSGKYWDMYVDECVWFWIVKGAARMARLAQSFSTFKGFQYVFSEVDIRNMKIEDFQRAVRMCTATDRCGSGLFASEGACWSWSCRFSAFPEECHQWALDRLVTRACQMVEVVESTACEEWEEGELIPRMSVRSTLLEVRKLLCVTRSFEGFFLACRLERKIRWKPIRPWITSTHSMRWGWWRCGCEACFPSNESCSAVWICFCVRNRGGYPRIKLVGSLWKFVMRGDVSEVNSQWRMRRCVS